MKLFMLSVLWALSVSQGVSYDLEWLPKGSSYPIQFLDPAACQQGISLLTYEVEGEIQQVMYVPVSLCMRQQFVRITSSELRHLDLGLAFSIFSQFSVVDVGEAYMGGLQNADYRISAVGSYQLDSQTHLRMSVFHQSSHLGDDYIIRNEIRTQTLRTLNFEQVDLMLSKGRGAYRGYVGGGFNFSPNTIRKRILLQGGADLIRPLKNHSGLALKTGFDIKLHAQNDFGPNLKFGFGLEIGRWTQAPFSLMLTWYQGNLPYSTLEYQKVRLMGLSLFIDLDKRL